MTQPAPLERVAAAWSQRVRLSLRWLTWGAAALLVLVSAHVARGGTVPWRIAGGLVLVAALALVARKWWRKRQQADAQRTIRQVLRPAQPELAERALRAIALVERTTHDPTEGSPELARAHFDRLLSRTSVDAVQAAATRRAGHYVTAAAALAGLCGIMLTLGPMRVIEGLSVLVARQGQAPVEVLWLDFPRVQVRFPRYLQRPDQHLGIQGQIVLPEGSEVIVRGRERHPGRSLVLTDGESEMPFVTDAQGGKVARITLMKSGALGIAARFGDVLVHEPRKLQVAVVADRAPLVELQGAPRQLPLLEMETLDLRWRAQDDHALRQIDLVLRSGTREERRPLATFDGNVSERTGAHSLSPSDSFLKRAFFPVAVTIEARDSNPNQGAGWGKSDAFTILPPAIGQPEAERYQALVEARAAFVASLARLLTTDANAPKARPEEELDVLVKGVAEALARVETRAPLAHGLRGFITSQIESLERAVVARTLFVERLERATLAIDAAARGLATRHAQTVSIRLGDVAEEVAVGARIARESEQRGRGVQRVDEGLAVLTQGQPQLTRLGDLGKDLGGVLYAGLQRIGRVRANEDMFHTELAALHLAARLRRPTPSFSALSQGSGGVESGAGGAGPPGDAASHADQQFEHLAEQLSELVENHDNNLNEVERALNEAAAEAASEANPEARERAEALRRAVARLPEPGQAPSTAEAAAALAREHTNAMAQGIEGQQLQDAVESAQNALSAFEEAERRAQGDGWLAEQLQQGKQEVERQLEWAKQQLAQQQQRAAERAREALQQAGSLERELSRLAQHLSEGDSAQVALPEEARGRLEQAQQLMDRAAQRLAEGQGKEALELQREAQRLLEQANQDPSTESEPEARRDDATGGKGLALGGEVPGENARARAEEFRRRVLEGLGRGRTGPLAPAVKRYAEGLLQ